MRNTRPQAAERGPKITAVTLAVEVGTFKRFERATQLMSYTGMVPSEHSSGTRRYQGAITKTGNNHLRRVLIESAWHYRHRPPLPFTTMGAGPRSTTAPNDVRGSSSVSYREKS